ncbi:MAG: hypothetical protein ACE5G0_12540 [Rhodothermales bacterium]
MYGLLVVCFLAFCMGCEEDVDAVLGTDQVFSLFGVFTPQADTQKVRVYPIEGMLQPASPIPLDARFTSTDMQTGDVRVWRDSLVQEANGQVAHIFWSPFRAEYGHTYRVEVARSDGAVARVDVIVPPFADLIEQETPAGFPIRAPVLVDGEVPRLLKVEVTYHFRARFLSETNLEVGEVLLSYDDKIERVSGGWVIPVDLSTDFLEIRRRLLMQGRLDANFGIQLSRIRLDLIAASEDWNPPGGVFDADVLVQPGTLSNVEGGFGLVAAGYRLDKAWLPPNEVLRAAGFTVSL